MLKLLNHGTKHVIQKGECMIYSGRQTWSQATSGQHKAPPLQETKLVNHLRYTEVNA